MIAIDYFALTRAELDSDVTALVGRAYDSDGLGILAVTNIPQSLETLRLELLEKSRQLANLPEEILARFEHPDYDYVVGWSRGREKFNGKPDLHKASWYANGLYADAAQNDSELIRKYPSSTFEPHWPDQRIHNFSKTLRALSRNLYDLSYHVLRHCDAFLDKKMKKRRFFLLPRRKRQKLATVTHELSRLHVARLLHYYPLDDDNKDSSWCGWHNDNSVITALAPAAYFDETLRTEVDAPEGAGLFVKPRNQSLPRVKVIAPKEGPYALFQIGEAAQVLSGGLLVATPHAVEAGKERSVSRDAFALFVEPNWDFPLRPPPGFRLKDVYAENNQGWKKTLFSRLKRKRQAAGHEEEERAAPLIPPLKKRLPKVPVDFAQFLADSVKEYY